MTTTATRAVYYALDAHPRSLFQLRRSIAGVRRYAATLPIYVVMAGALPDYDRAFLRASDVTVLPARLDAGTSPTFMKWRALAEGFSESDVLYLDADTLVFDDPARLFDLAGPEDFHARLEAACAAEPEAYPYVLNVTLVTNSIVDHTRFAQISARLAARVMPVFNTGVMLFRNGLARRLATCWPEFLRLQRLFRHKRLPYPCRNAHVLEQIVAPLVLGTLEPITHAFVTREASPFYLEYRGGHVPSPGIVLHAWSAFYPPCIFEFEGRDVAEAYLRLPAHDTSRWAALRAGLLLLGTSVCPLSESWQERWIRLTPARHAPRASATREPRAASR